MTRNQYLDFAKGLLIFLVVFGHVIAHYGGNPLEDPLFEWINSFHMPCFFFISGYLADGALKKGISECCRKKTRRILIPAIAWTVIHFVMLNAVFELLNRPTFLSIRDFYMEMRGVWFLFALYVFFLMASFLWQRSHRYLIGFIIAAFLILSYPYMPIDVLKHFHIVDYWHVFLLGLLYKNTPPTGRTKFIFI